VPVQVRPPAPAEFSAVQTLTNAELNVTDTATILQLKISRFRGLENFQWYPQPGLNIILGGGDVGKTTILDAVGLLLSPTNTSVVSESDYWNRDDTQEFSIEAVMSLPASSEISTQRQFTWPWEWDGKNAVLPTGDDQNENPSTPHPVYRVRVRGTSELEVTWEIVQPQDTADHFSVAVRRKIGVVRLSSDERNDRDLRLVYGSALDRLLSDPALRARIGKRVSEIDLHEPLGDKGKQTLGKLDKRLQDAALPGDLTLGLTSSQGLSIGALIGLLAGKNGISLPLASWGAGTRRMAALEIASATETEASIVVMDEIERGLEPYRLRKLIAALSAGSGQAFVTTHSPVAIACAQNGHLWFLDATGKIGALPHAKIEAQQRRDPETFLARIAVIAEGVTEVGFLTFLLEKAFETNPLDFGVRVCDGQGNDAALTLLETLSDANLLFVGLVDDDGESKGRWAKLKTKLGDKLLQWEGGCTEQRVIGALKRDQLLEFITDPEGGLTGYRLRSLADRLGIDDKAFESIEQATAEKGIDLVKLIIAAAKGSKEGAPDKREKEWHAHARSWFKSESGGRELAGKMASLGAWPALSPVMMPFINSILVAAGKPKRDQLKL
jgi:putative ATP-dependent endonuclease of the OLD family